MTSSDSLAGAWSRRRWAAVIFATFAVHVGALLLVSSRQPVHQRRAESPASVHWLTEPVGARKMIDLLLLTDPTQFAMVHARGFSGVAWLRTSSVEYRPSEWTEEQRTLAQPTHLLGGAFRQAAAAGAPPVFDAARKPAAAPPALVIPESPLRTRSQLRLEGPVRGRRLAVPLALESRPHNDLLADTRVEVQVTADGLVFTPRLVGVTNAKDPVQRAADLRGLELARQLRFEPAPKHNRVPVDGVLVFQWHTVEPPAAPKL